MKKFLLKCIFISIPLFLLLLVLEITVRRIPNDYTLKKLNHNNEGMEVLVMGNSHAMYGINPKYLKLPTFNAALPAQTIDIDYKILENQKESLNSLKYIIVPVDYYSFYAKIEDGNNYVRKFRYNQFMGLSILSLKDYLKFDKLLIFLEKGLKPTFLSVYNNLLFNTNNITCEKNGYFLAEGQVDLEKSGVIHSERHNKFYDYENYIYNLNYLNRIILLAKESKWNIILINTPTWDSYRKHLYPERVKNIYNNLLRLTYEHNHVYYLDLFDDSSFSKEDFYDDSHLGKLGAIKLSIGLNQLIKSIEENETSERYINSINVSEQ